MITGLKQGQKYFICLGTPKNQEYVFEKFICEDDNTYLFRDDEGKYDIVIRKNWTTLTKDKLRAIIYYPHVSGAIGKTKSGGNY